MHADHLLGRDPSRIVFVPTAFQRWCVLLRPYPSCTDPSSVRSLPSGTRGVAWNPPIFIYYCCLGCRGPRPPHPYRATSYCAASSTVIITHGIRRGSLGAFMVLNLGDTQGRSTPETIDLKETLSCLAVLLVDSSPWVPPCWPWSTPEDRTVHYTYYY